MTHIWPAEAGTPNERLILRSAWGTKRRAGTMMAARLGLLTRCETGPRMEPMTMDALPDTFTDCRLQPLRNRASRAIGGVLCALVILTVGCRSVYYSTWEKFGKYKRDLLQSKVKQVRDDQKETTEQLKDALTRLQEIYGFKGGELEKMYRRLQSDYDDSAAKAETLRKRIREMDQIASDLFKEWEKEDASISTPS